MMPKCPIALRTCSHNLAMTTEPCVMTSFEAQQRAVRGAHLPQALRPCKARSQIKMILPPEAPYKPHRYYAHQVPCFLVNLTVPQALRPCMGQGRALVTSAGVPHQDACCHAAWAKKPSRMQRRQAPVTER